MKKKTGHFTSQQLIPDRIEFDYHRMLQSSQPPTVRGREHDAHSVPLRSLEELVRLPKELVKERDRLALFDEACGHGLLLPERRVDDSAEEAQLVSSRGQD